MEKFSGITAKLEANGYTDVAPVLEAYTHAVASHERMSAEYGTVVQMAVLAKMPVIETLPANVRTEFADAISAGAYQTMRGANDVERIIELAKYVMFRNQIPTEGLAPLKPAATTPTPAPAKPAPGTPAKPVVAPAAKSAAMSTGAHGSPSRPVPMNEDPHAFADRHDNLLDDWDKERSQHI